MPDQITLLIIGIIDFLAAIVMVMAYLAVPIQTEFILGLAILLLVKGVAHLATKSFFKGPMDLVFCVVLFLIYFHISIPVLFLIVGIILIIKAAFSLVYGLVA